jgi:hypothetical protein
MYHFSRMRETCKDLNYRSTVCAFQREGCAKGVAVKPADSCESISRAHNQSLTLFAGLNPSINCRSLIVGQVVCVLPGEQC